jgi:hypothetical protein
MDETVKKVSIVIAVVMILAVGGMFAFKGRQSSNAVPPPDPNPVTVDIPEPTTENSRTDVQVNIPDPTP